MSQTPSQTPAQKVVEYIGISSAALDTALKTAQVKEAQAAQIDALIPSVVKSLIDNKLIMPDQEKKAAEILKDPVQALDLLKKVASHMAEALPIGQAVDKPGQVKKAGSDPYVGRRSTELKESDLALARGLGVELSGH